MQPASFSRQALETSLMCYSTGLVQGRNMNPRGPFRATNCRKSRHACRPHCCQRGHRALLVHRPSRARPRCTSTKRVFFLAVPPGVQRRPRYAQLTGSVAKIGV
ncbi:hypothetical protein BD309DRAFT_736918 [Dichomitus squalens]|nr:hypothetical protein BD309DRAFT_736918 [Dichomitus squalens]